MFLMNFDPNNSFLSSFIFSKKINNNKITIRTTQRKAHKQQARGTRALLGKGLHALDGNNMNNFLVVVVVVVLVVGGGPGVESLRRSVFGGIRYGKNINIQFCYYNSNSHFD